ncbi:9837_t:CDS:2, partial [Cetraspora pellucida]
TGVYPIKSEDNEIEIILFVPIDEDERDPNIQSVFARNEYYSICEKIVPGTYNSRLRLKITVTSSTHLTIRRDLGSNKCLLKTSLIGVTQDMPKEVDYENAIFKVLVNDYAGQHYSFIVKIAFPYQYMEIIEEDLYIYAADISHIDINSIVKKKFSDLNNSSTAPEIYKSGRKYEEKHNLVENADLDYDGCEQIFEYNRECVDENSEYESSIVDEDRKMTYNHNRVNKSKEKMAQHM